MEIWRRKAPEPPAWSAIAHAKAPPIVADMLQKRGAAMKAQNPKPRTPYATLTELNLVSPELTQQILANVSIGTRAM
jgi:hypothetical protein